MYFGAVSRACFRVLAVNGSAREWLAWLIDWLIERITVRCMNGDGQRLKDGFSRGKAFFGSLRLVCVKIVCFFFFWLFTKIRNTEFWRSKFRKLFSSFVCLKCTQWKNKALEVIAYKHSKMMHAGGGGERGETPEIGKLMGSSPHSKAVREREKLKGEKPGKITNSPFTNQDWISSVSIAEPSRDLSNQGRQTSRKSLSGKSGQKLGHSRESYG